MVSGENFSGRIDAAHVYNHGLTAREIQAMMNTPLLPLEAGGHTIDSTATSGIAVPTQYGKAA